MKIDLAAGPPSDLFRDRKKHLAISLFLLVLVVGGLLLMAYCLLSDTPYSAALENTALALFVVPALFFAYFGAKLKNYKKLSPEEKGRLRELASRYPEIAAYSAQVAGQGREMSFGEYEACREWAEEREQDARG